MVYFPSLLKEALEILLHCGFGEIAGVAGYFCGGVGGFDGFDGGVNAAWGGGGDCY